MKEKKETNFSKHITLYHGSSSFIFYSHFRKLVEVLRLMSDMISPTETVWNGLSGIIFTQNF